MQTRVSTKGQVVLPSPLRRRLGIRSGDPLDIAIEGSRIVLTTRQHSKASAKIVNDPITGLPVLQMADEQAAVMTSRDVEDILASFV